MITQETVDALDAQTDEGLSLLEMEARIPRVEHVLLGLARPPGSRAWPCPIPYSIDATLENPSRV